MPLFQQSVLNKYLSQQDKDLVHKAYKKYSKYFHNTAIQENIRNSKEEQFQEGFLRELFVEVLGYTLNPAAKFNLTTELKNLKGAKKADGAILKDHKAVAVIELKGTGTKDLESIRQQAFDYKANHVGCTYIITSNFEKLRFYINNAVDFEEFNLFSMTVAEFEMFFLCLAKDNILSDKPLTIKEASIVEEENITKKFYADYSLFKRELYRDLVKQNRNNVMLRELSEKTSKLMLFKKSQKLIDRFLFILFAEDRGLLAPNSIDTVLREWKALADLDMQVPLYDRYKQYFNFLDTGRKGTDNKEEIFAYNGGLFQPDTILDAVVIDDDLLYRHTKKLMVYDFESQVDVNILGHIFEHSLNEIESINAEIEGTDFDKQKTKRKKDGVFYTPKYITKYIVDNTIGKLCTEKKQELSIIDEEYAKGRKKRQATTIIRLDQQLKDYREWLLELTICDPACGSGAFLNQALDFLIREHGYIDELNKQLFGGGFAFPDIENQILEHNIYGVDLNEESIEIAKLSLWLRTAQPKRKLTRLSNNIKCGNSLIESRTIAGDKAFKWKEEFPEVFARGGFDVIVGNPPYVSKRFNEDEKSYFKRKYKTAQYQLELYVLFMELSVTIIKNNGKLSFIVPNSWMKNLMFGQCRFYLLENVSFDVIIPNLENVFSEASVDTCIFISSNSQENNEISIGDFKKGDYSLKHRIDQGRLLKNDKYIFDIEISKESESIFNKIDEHSIRLENICDITRGINPYDKYRGQSEEIIKTKAYHSDYKKNDTFLPELRGRHVNRYNYKWDNVSYVSYGEWLAAPREKKYFEGERVLCRQILGTNLNCSLISEFFIIDQSVFIAKITEENIKYYNTKYILSLLASKLISFYFKNKANEFDALFPKIKIGEFKNLPIKKNGIEEQQPFIDKADLMVSLNKEFQEQSEKFKRTIQRKFELQDLQKKLQDWYLLTYPDFIKELGKKKIKLSLSQEAEWEDYFVEESKKALELKNRIDVTDREIDKMVYELYGLSEEEIGIVENS